jgi:putative transposase
MKLADLLKGSLDTAQLERWQRERTATLTRRFASRSHTRNRRFLGTPVRAFAVRLHATGCSLGETAAILRCFGVERSFQAILQWVHRMSDSVPDPSSFTRAPLS